LVYFVDREFEAGDHGLAGGADRTRLIVQTSDQDWISAQRCMTQDERCGKRAGYGRGGRGEHLASR
jgi:hypothetical protein